MMRSGCVQTESGMATLISPLLLSTFASQLRNKAWLHAGSAISMQSCVNLFLICQKMKSLLSLFPWAMPLTNQERKNARKWMQFSDNKIGIT